MCSDASIRWGKLNRYFREHLPLGGKRERETGFTDVKVSQSQMLTSRGCLNTGRDSPAIKLHQRVSRDLGWLFLQPKGPLFEMSSAPGRQAAGHFTG